MRFCLLHGAWHDGTCWDQLVSPLALRGHEAVAPDLPFHDPSASFAERVRPALAAIDGAEDIVVVGHSMAAHHYAPFVAAARANARLVRLCPGLGPLRNGFPWPATRPDGTSVWDVDTAIAAMYPRLDAQTALRLARSLRPMAPAPDDPPAIETELATVVVYATDDELFDPTLERSAAQSARVEAIEIPGGHFPMAEDPTALADLFDRLRV